MKTKQIILSAFVIAGVSGVNFAQIGPPGNPGNGGQPGSQNNPYDHLYVNDYIKVGTSSLWLNSFTSPGIENRLFSTDGPLSINGTFGANGSVPASPGNNTLINSRNGLVGIGLLNPNAKLDIRLESSYDAREAGVRITVPLTKSEEITDANIFHIRKEFNIAIGGSQVVQRTLLVAKDNGNVGIGISNPDDKMHVHNGRMKITGTNSFGGPMILFGGSTATAPAGQWGIEYIPEQNGLPGLNFWKPFGSTNGSGGGGFGNYFLFLADNGKVSIGLDPNDPDTYNGNYKLYVGTGIMTEKVRVAIHASSDWADYVFDKNYKLMPLDDVDAFINKNGHLPNVPSAEEVTEQGIDVAKMDAKLLEKIEELTLYMIELKKENDELKRESTLMKEKIEKLIVNKEN